MMNKKELINTVAVAFAPVVKEVMDGVVERCADLRLQRRMGYYADLLSRIDTPKARMKNVTYKEFCAMLRSVQDHDHKYRSGKLISYGHIYDIRLSEGIIYGKIAVSLTWDFKHHQLLVWISEDPEQLKQDTNIGNVYRIPEKEFKRAITFEGTGTEDTDAVRSNSIYKEAVTEAVEKAINEKYPSIARNIEHVYTDGYTTRFAATNKETKSNVVNM